MNNIASKGFVQYERSGSVARITLNRPEVYHSLNLDMVQELQAALDQAGSEPSVRALLLTASGKAFCAGQDLGEFLVDGQLQPADLPDFSRMVEERYIPLIIRIGTMEKPVVAAVNGVAAGAGANLALACDLVVAAESARFVQAFSQIGLVPDSGGTYFLPRLIGTQRAAALMFLGEPVSATEAESMGMIYRTYPDQEFETASLELAERLAALPTQALAYTKKLLSLSAENTLEAQLRKEGEYQKLAGSTEDFTEGVRAFLEKRKASFKGR